MANDEAKHAEQVGRGASIGRYLVLSLLGKGGMGEVYAAYDPELDRKVAIKVLRVSSTAGTDRAEGQARILREAQALAQLSDPNVVAVYDVGTFDERVFIAMEFVDGSTLSFWRQRGPRTWREIVDVYAAAGRGLAAAHRRGLIHRDFKPDNVMLSHDGQVRVMDFGLARSEKQAASDVPREAVARAAAAAPAALEGDWETVTRNLAQPAPSLSTSSSSKGLLSPLTQAGAMMGTPAYMAPEQFEGKVADAKSDQFSFCVALYEALYDQRPFAGKDLIELAAQVEAGRVRPPTPKAQVPGWLRKVLLRGLRAKREERHPSMEALLSALSRDPRRRWLRTAAAGGLALLIASLTVGLVHASQKQQQVCLGGAAKLAGVWEPAGQVGAPLSPRKEGIRLAFMKTGKRYAAEAFSLVQSGLDRYVTSWNDMHRDACEANHVRREQSDEVLDLRMLCLQDRFNEVRALTAVLSDADGEVVSKSAAAVQSLRPLQECADVVTLKAVLRPPRDPVARQSVAEVRVALAEVKAERDAGRLKKASARLEQVIVDARKTSYAPVIAEALLASAEVASLQGDTPVSEQRWEQAMWSAVSARYDEVALLAAAELVYAVGYRQSRFVDGERWVQFAEAIQRRLGDGYDQAAGWLANNRGLLYEREGKLELALEASREAVAIKTRAFGPNHFDVALSEDNVAEILLALGRVDEALTRNEHALGVFEATVGPDHPLMAFALRNHADILKTKGRYEEAMVAAERVVQIGSRELDPHHPLIGFAYVYLGESLLGLGHPNEAITALEQAMKFAEHDTDDAALMGQAMYAFARALMAAHKAPARVRALSLAHEAAALFRKTPGHERRALEADAWADRGGLDATEKPPT